jgi:prepilin-type processing-associated H-X9-DG protein
MLTGIGRARQTALTSRCLSNLRQLQMAWQMYSEDNSGSCVPNKYHLTNGVYRGYQDTWAGENSVIADRDDKMLAKGLFVRLGYARETQLFRCPSDRSQIERQPRTRSYSISAYFMGTTNYNVRPISKVADISNPGRAFVVLDELAETIDDGHFFILRPPDSRWFNMPADRHLKGGSLSFADGHAERWQWKGKKRFAPSQGDNWIEVTSRDQADLRRLQAALPKRPGE